MIRRSFRHVVTALLLLVAVLCQETWALAGTTGGLSGTVIDAGTSAPVAGAQVTVTSPSQSSTGTTDAGGHFNFLTLAPDTYTVSVVKSGFQPYSQGGQVVFADTVQQVAVRLSKALQTIARVSAQGAGSLVKSGTTADIYSVNQATQQSVAALGGGGNLNSAYSAISTVPGAYVVPNQSGYADTVHIRGGDYDQVGYEFDGVPVNRSFDNYPSGAASSLGNAEVQVYTGANPANSEGQGLAGYINQVIQTGTYPGFADGQLGIGTPVYYHRAAVEAGGATPDRLFSYYVGVAGYNNDYEYINNNNGSNYSSWLGDPVAPMNNPNYAGTSFAPICGPGAAPGCGGGYFLGPIQYQNFATTASRDAVINLHFGIPHHNDAGRDDVQILFDSSQLFNSFNTSNDDFSSAQCSGANAASGPACYQYVQTVGNGWPSTPPYVDGFQWTCGGIGATYTTAQLNTAGPNCSKNYYYPSSTNRSLTFLQCAGSGNFGACNIPDAARDSSQNAQEIVKLQYTKNLGSNAYVRLYGYTYYSNWILYGPQCAWTDFACDTAPDYELSSHTRGVSGQFSDQFNSQNLVSLQASYVTASTIRDNNTQMFNSISANRAVAAVVVNAADPYSGYCYGPGGGTAVTCVPGTAQTASWGDLQGAGAAPLPATCSDPRVKSTTCTYLLANNSQWATYNNVTPQFFSASATDEFRPNDKVLLNLGIRLDSFTFIGGNASVNNNGNGVARQFWYNAYNLDTCVNPLDGAQLTNPTPGGSCSAAFPNVPGVHAAQLQNIASQSFTFNIWQPRLSGTYTLSPETVLRASFGRYTEAPNTAYEIYNQLTPNLPFALLGPILSKYGRNAPGLPIQPPTSINYDVSLEQHLKGTDWSFKLTPFLRQTQEQVQNFYLDQATGFVSGTNVGSQRSQGVEFQVQKGDFSRNGLSGLLSFAYTNSYIKYGTLPNSLGTVLSPINSNISTYNAYTKGCAAGGALHGKVEYGQPVCGATTSGAPASACYVAGVAAPCGAPGAVANPYWNAPTQNLIDPGQNFATYDIFPSGIGSSTQSYGSPYVSTLVLNYKHDRWAVTPSFQFQGGSRYGAPETTPGIDPANAACTPIPGTLRYNVNTCYSPPSAPAVPSVVIPDPYTGTFDNIGSFTQPNEFMVNLQASYDVSPRVTLTGTLANIVNTCWGGTQAPWTFGDHNICSYGAVGNGLIAPVNAASGCHTNSGATCNPGQIVQPFLQYPYEPAFGPALVSALNNSVKAPFQFYISAKIKI